MAYIEPNSTIHLLHNVPIEPTFENSVWYSSKEAQEQDFLRYKKYSLTENSYVRKSKGVIRVELTMGQAYDCNYLMFKNTSFENKWFYAFISKVDYVNNATVDIFFDIDVLQTWLLDFSFHDSFIEREHCVTDTPDEWLMQEGVDPGPYYVYDQESFFSRDTSLSVVLATPFQLENRDGTWIIINYGNIHFSGGVPSAIYYTTFDFDSIAGLAELREILQALNGTIQAYYQDGTSAGQKANAISEVISIFIAPTVLFNSDALFSGLWDTYIPVERDDIPASASANNNSTSYHFRNKKLTAYPFSYYVLTDHNGNDTIYKPELFIHDPNNEWVTFNVYGDTAPNGGLLAYPRKYHGYGANNNPSQLPTDSKMDGSRMSGFPAVSWSVDVWKSWLASTGIEGAVSSIKSTITSIIEDQHQMRATATATQDTNSDSFLMKIPGIRATAKSLQATLNVGKHLVSPFTTQSGFNLENAADKALKIGGAAMTLYSTIQNLSQYYQQSLKPNTVMGAQSGGAKIANNQLNLTLVHYGIGIERAKILDRFFDAYGYQINRFGVPHLFSLDGKARAYYNYIKTSGANVGGLIPKEDADSIAAILDSGVRFWSGVTGGEHASALDNVNNYELNNIVPVG